MWVTWCPTRDPETQLPPRNHVAAFPKAFRAARQARAVGRPAAATKIIRSWGSYAELSDDSILCFEDV